MTIGIVPMNGLNSDIEKSMDGLGTYQKDLGQKQEIPIKGLCPGGPSWKGFCIIRITKGTRDDCPGGKILDLISGGMMLHICFCDVFDIIYNFIILFFFFIYINNDKCVDVCRFHLTFFTFHYFVNPLLLLLLLMTINMPVFFVIN